MTTPPVVVQKIKFEFTRRANESIRDKEDKATKDSHFRFWKERRRRGVGKANTLEAGEA